MKAVCATRQGAMLRFLRKAQNLWLASGSTNEESLFEDLEYIMALVLLPEHEAQDILEEVDQGYPWLDEVYSNATQASE